MAQFQSGTVNYCIGPPYGKVKNYYSNLFYSLSYS